jgi:hypothetical protein
MDFIERYLGFAPDSGDGRLEETLIVIVLVALIVVLARRFFHRISRLKQ